MSKNIVYLVDGTWQSPKNKTNVWETYCALKGRQIENYFKKDSKSKQIAKYEKGVWGPVFGSGIIKHIRKGYKFISENYELGDKICLFGYSRGAYAVRSLASFIYFFGLLKKDEIQKTDFDEIYEIYKLNRVDKFGKNNDFSEDLNEIRKKMDFEKVSIEAICVWDTVGAIGFKNSLKLRKFRKRDSEYNIKNIKDALAHEYHRMSLFSNIENFYHAMALDENRVHYYPEMAVCQKAKEAKNINEVWFPGTHSNVGGGYKKRALGNIALKWMFSKIKNQLVFDPERIESKSINYPWEIKKKFKRGFIFFRKPRIVPTNKSEWLYKGGKGSILHQSIIQMIKMYLKKSKNKQYKPTPLKEYADYNKAENKFGLKRFFRIEPFEKG